MTDVPGVKKQLPQKPLIIFEMANNHMGDLQHGLDIIRMLYAVIKHIDAFAFAIKFQYRHLETFIHPDFQGCMDHKYVKRFTETQLSEEQFLRLKMYAEQLGFMTICTPFDETSVGEVEKHGYGALKIASASFTDWPLLERIVMTDMPIIASTGGAKLEDIDKVVSFLQHRGKEFALMHCVGEYPTVLERLQLNQIDLFRQRYAGVPIGFSTHEEPGNTEAIMLAVAKGATIFEKHVGAKADHYPMNAYSATPVQAAQWVRAALNAYAMCGVVGQRHASSEKELADILQFQRGVFANHDFTGGDRIHMANTFCAWPNQPGQLLARDLSKYMVITSRGNVEASSPLVNVCKADTRAQVYEIVTRSCELLREAGIALSNKLNFEISHHYGIGKFYEAGAVIITCVNNEEYAKKLILLLPGQGPHPMHYHKLKRETFHVLHGNVIFTLDGVETKAGPGDVITVERGVKHNFRSEGGVVFEEISTMHHKGDSYYTVPAVDANKYRKTELTYWVV